MTSHPKIQTRSQKLKKASQQTWDIIIIGGGITGAGIFRQASLDGFKTLLVEKEDFASGTSWCSSKLIHGGLRYLEQYNFGLVAESVAEKNYLQKYAPNLVHILPFMFPVYKTDRRPLWMIYIGTWIYALLSKFKTRPNLLSKHDIATYASLIENTDLTGAVLYHDAQTVDAYLTLSAVKSGLNTNAHAFNHCFCEILLENDDEVHGVRVRDELTQKTFNLQSSWVINATGPWKNLPHKDTAPITYSKGSHILIKGNPFSIKTAVTMFSPEDGRVMFCIPWMGHTLVGTTDEPTEEKPDHVSISDKEVSYMKNTLSHYFPSVPTYDILSHFSGLRTLIGNPTGDLSQMKRDHQMDVPKKGLLQIYGGKLTAFAKMALDVMHKIQTIDRKPRSQRHNISFASVLSPHPKSLNTSIVEKMVEDELACTVSDVLIRRSLCNLLLEDHGKQHIPLVCEVLQRVFGYTEEQIHQQIQDFYQQSQQFETSQESGTN